MKKACFTIGVFYSLLMNAQPVADFPQTEITNGLIQAKLYLPSRNGYYRGSRFDWSGVIARLEYKEHNYFGQWFENYNPTIHDAIMGPVEDFYPVGYSEAKRGGRFIKIGIGALYKPDETGYSFSRPYVILNPGEWRVRQKPDRVEYVHKLDDEECAYEYTKTIHLVKGKPQMVLSHSLKNNGRKTIETTVYNHNFFLIDSQATGPAFAVKFGFNLAVDGEQTSELGQVQGNQIIFLKQLAKNDHLYYKSLQGFGDDAKDYDIRVENNKTGAGVRITSDRPLQVGILVCRKNIMSGTLYSGKSQTRRSV